MAYPHARSARGAALIIAMMLVAVLAVVALALVRRTTNEMDAIGGKRNYDRSVSCAEAGRQMLLSQFRVFGLDPTSIVLNTHAGNLNVYTGHYDQFAIQTVKAVAKGAGAGVNGTGAGMDQANRLSATGLGGTVYRFNVVCADSNNDHQSEVEFEVRFGL
ncbi:MAG TPA: PilX N-terminal domain-containing pilus assembly protein [Myxococcales bacterium]